MKRYIEMTHLYKLSEKKLIPSDFCREVFDFTSMTHLSAVRFHISYFKRSLYFIFNVEEFNFLNTDSLLIRSHMDHAARNHIFAALHFFYDTKQLFYLQTRLYVRRTELHQIGGEYLCTGKMQQVTFFGAKQERMKIYINMHENQEHMDVYYWWI